MPASAEIENAVYQLRSGTQIGLTLRGGGKVTGTFERLVDRALKLSGSGDQPTWVDLDDVVGMYLEVQSQGPE